jgi:hypothetical protein
MVRRAQYTSIVIAIFPTNQIRLSVFRRDSQQYNWKIEPQDK